MFSLANAYGKESERFGCAPGRQDERRARRKHRRMDHVTDRDSGGGSRTGPQGRSQRDLLPADRET